MTEDLLLQNERVLSMTYDGSIVFTNRRIMINPESAKRRSILIEAVNRLEVTRSGIQLMPLVAISLALGVYFGVTDHFMYAGLSVFMSLIFFLIHKFNSKKTLVISVKKDKDLSLNTSTLKTDVKELLNLLETARFERFNQRHQNRRDSGDETKLVKISA